MQLVYFHTWMDFSQAVERLANPIEVLADHMLVVAVIGLVVILLFSSYFMAPTAVI